MADNPDRSLVNPGDEVGHRADVGPLTDVGRGVDDFVALVDLVTEGDPPPRPRREAVARDLLARWAEPHRRYHTGSHLRATLDAVRRLLAGEVAPEIELAVWFHDAVYTGRPGADEEASARLAEVALTGLGVPGDRVAEVARLVRSTAGHDPAPDDHAGQVLHDADLAVLASDPTTYRAYARAVREEYAHVPEAEFRAGRAAVLRGLVDVSAVYRTTVGRALWEAAARENVAAELGLLAGPGGPEGKVTPGGEVTPGGPTRTG